jgi:exopolyphosphatase/guanosine-5'-triphosphate,3'-diphosphate pyrophosphatase
LASERAYAGGREAVIDIGSNSVRLVIYEGPKRAPFPICNEKALCGLGRDMSEDGALNPQTVGHAMETLRRFRRLLEEHGNPPTHVVATAAVREAKDGRAFIRKIETLGFSVALIDGAEEAALAALGVVACEPRATGLVGDMGGGSLELIALNAGEIGDSVSLSIGPLRLMQKTGGKASAAADLAAEAIKAVPWLKDGKFEAIYSVGGSWRSIARIHMRLRNYPLSVLHHYEMSKAEAIDVCNLVARQSSRSLEEIPGISFRRIDTLPIAALVLKAVLQETGSSKVIVSAGGLREGVLYKALKPAQRALDPLFEGARFLAERLEPNPEIGDILVALTARLFKDESPEDRRLREAVCILSDIAAYFHPDLRALQAFETVLHAPFYGISHRERVVAATAAYARHDGKAPVETHDRFLRLLSSEDLKRALQLGLALRFAGALAPKAPAALIGCTLERLNGKLVFRAPKRIESLMGEMPRRRLEALAVAFDAAPSEDYF